MSSVPTRIRSRPAFFSDAFVDSTKVSTRPPAVLRNPPRLEVDPNMSVTLPELRKFAAFICPDTSSTPVLITFSTVRGVPTKVVPRLSNPASVNLSPVTNWGRVTVRLVDCSTCTVALTVRLPPMVMSWKFWFSRTIEPPAATGDPPLNCSVDAVPPPGTLTTLNRLVVLETLPELNRSVGPPDA